MTTVDSNFSESVHRFRIAGMDCAEEVGALRAALGPVVGEEHLAFDVLNRRLTVRIPDGHATTPEDVLRAIQGTGMDAEPWSSDGRGPGGGGADRLRRFLCASSGMLLAAGYLIHAVRHGALHALAGDETGAAFPLASILAYAAAVVCGAWFVLPRAWGALRRLRPDMNLLMVVAITGAVLIGEWFEAAAVSFLFSFALLLESWSVDRARRAIERLLDLSPPTARVLGAGDRLPSDVPVESVEPGALISVRPGELIPLDGIILEGESTIDEASLTGESIPVVRGADDPVYAGTINADAALVIRATRPASDSALARIIHMVEDAQARRAPTERWAETFALRYTPIMMAVAILIAVVPPLLGWMTWSESVYRSLVVLVIACPCALVISTPVSIVAALAAAARNGVLIKGGVYLEAAAGVRAVALDKTGTLTRGELRVEDVEALEGHDVAEILASAAALEARSNHPLAKAVVAYAESVGVPVEPAAVLRELPGRGAEGEVDGRSYWIGGHRLAHERVEESDLAHRTIAGFESRGLTAVVIGTDKHVCGVLGLADEIRPEAPGILERLHRAGVERVVMLTGDHQEAADRVARATGVDEVRAGLLPEDKVRAIEELNAAHGSTVMVGDGINDAPALAMAGIGVAMGAVGSDVAIEAADIALMSDNLDRLPWLMEHGQRTLRVIRQNVVLALGAKVVVLVLATLGIASLWMAIAADMGASLVVIANALRLLRE